MLTDARRRIQELCDLAMAVSDRDQIEPILSELRIALHDKIQNGENWIALCERAAVEQDPKKLLELVSEINRRFEARERRLTGHAGSKPPDKPSNL
jgi:hypothetical protein